jgi:hypothetical protein
MIMKWGRLILVLGLLAGGWPARVSGQSKASGPATITQLDWLAGSWRMEMAGRIVEEQWMAPAGGVMLGMSRTVTKGRIAEHEFMQVREGPGGDLFFIAQPARQKEAAFKLLSQTASAVVFENKEHDFPQLIGYALRADGNLLAYREGPKADGTTRRIEFIFRRVTR